MIRLLRCADVCFRSAADQRDRLHQPRHTVTSVPPGAEVSINHRVIGVTPIRVGFTHYGTYRIELRKEKYR